MPTAARAISAILFAVLGYFIAEMVVPLLPEGMPTTWLNEPVAAIGLLMGWNVVGRRAGDGYRASMGYGLTAVALIAFWSVVIFAGYDMLQNSIDRRYRGPMEAVQAFFGISVAHFRLIATPEILGSLFFGGVFGGWIAEWASRRWT